MMAIHASRFSSVEIESDQLRVLKYLSLPLYKSIETRRATDDRSFETRNGLSNTLVRDPTVPKTLLKEDLVFVAPR
jgi:hypothetical protein